MSTKDNYIKKYISLIIQANTKPAKEALEDYKNIIDKIYDDGFEDGTNENENEAQKITSKELHEIEMELCYLLDNNELTREAIINNFTPLINKAR